MKAASSTQGLQLFFYTNSRISGIYSAARPCEPEQHPASSAEPMTYSSKEIKWSSSNLKSCRQAASSAAVSQPTAAHRHPADSLHTCRPFRSSASIYLFQHISQSCLPPPLHPLAPSIPTVMVNSALEVPTDAQISYCCTIYKNSMTEKQITAEQHWYSLGAAKRDLGKHTYRSSTQPSNSASDTFASLRSHSTGQHWS